MNNIRKEVRELCDIIIKSGEAEFDYSELNDDELSWLSVNFTIIGLIFAKLLTNRC